MLWCDDGFLLRGANRQDAIANVLRWLLIWRSHCAHRTSRLESNQFGMLVEHNWTQFYLHIIPICILQSRWFYTIGKKNHMHCQTLNNYIQVVGFYTSARRRKKPFAQETSAMSAMSRLISTRDQCSWRSPSWPATMNQSMVTETIPPQRILLE